VSIGRLARTVWELDPRQVVGRAGFRLRRATWPVVRHLPVGPASPPALARRDALPATAPFDEGDLAAIERGVLRLAGHEAALPAGPAFEPAERDPLYRYQLHEHGWLREGMERGSPALRGSLARWLESYWEARFPAGSVAIDPYPLATRMLQWQGLVQRGLVEPERVAAPMVEATRLLAGLSETHLLANHLLRDRAAMVVGSAWVGGRIGELLRARAAAALVDEASAQFLPDGMHEERCPAYHAHATMDLLFALEALSALASAGATELDRARAALHELAGRAMGALEAVAHEDDRVAAFGDSAPLSAPSVREIVSWADALGVRWERASSSPFGAGERRTLPVSGFTRASVGHATLFVSHGPFGAPSQPGHAHCDLFAIELDVAGRRVIVDPGVHAYHDERWRTETRASAAHATPSLRGREQAEVWSRFRCGWRPRAIETRFGEAHLEGEARAFGPHDPRTLRRRVRVEGDAFEVEDRIEGEREIEVALPLAPGLSVVRDGERAVRVEVDGDAVLRVTLREGRLDVEDAHVSHRFGARSPAPRLRLRGGGSVAYTLLTSPRAEAPLR
jgi:hypothetical protein